MAGHCANCRYWSGMVARADFLVVKALCLSTKSPMSGDYTSGNRQCDAYREATHGPIDNPALPEGTYPVEVAA